MMLLPATLPSLQDLMHTPEDPSPALTDLLMHGFYTPPAASIEETEEPERSTHEEEGIILSQSYVPSEGEVSEGPQAVMAVPVPPPPTMQFPRAQVEMDIESSDVDREV